MNKIQRGDREHAELVELRYTRSCPELRQHDACTSKDTQVQQQHNPQCNTRAVYVCVSACAGGARCTIALKLQCATRALRPSTTLSRHGSNDTRKRARAVARMNT
eukprot:7508389-Alexandrium_andersonii.AAC.1